MYICVESPSRHFVSQISVQDSSTNTKKSPDRHHCQMFRYFFMYKRKIRQKEPDSRLNSPHKDDIITYPKYLSRKKCLIADILKREAIPRQ